MDSNLKPSNEHWMEAGIRGNGVQTTSVANYAKQVMKRSLITGVSNIAESKSNWKRYFKLMVLVFCTCGFFYQATLFMTYIFTYPSVVNIEVYVPEVYTHPAYTFCNNNGIKRTKFCAKYPERCTMPESVEEFCATYSSFCASLKNKTHFLVVKEDYYDYEKQLTAEELLELSHDYESMVIKGFYRNPSRLFNEFSVDQISGPFIIRRLDGVLIICHSYFLRVESELDPYQFRRKLRGTNQILILGLNVEADEVFIPEKPAGFLFHVHTPFTLENPSLNGMFIEPKHQYIIHFYLEEEHLLPDPFQSNCTNYRDLWLKNNRTGPRSQESCFEKCEMEYCFEDCNCSFPDVFYPTTGPICTSEYVYCHENLTDEIRIRLDDELDKCNSKCNDDCQKFEYRYNHQFRLQQRNSYKSNNTEIDGESTIDVSVICSKQEVLKYNHRPQYQKLDVFSSLGGFIGAWLGVSLVAVVDLLESFTKIAIFFFRRKQISQ